MLCASSTSLFSQRGLGRRSGLAMDVKAAQVHTLRDGKAVRLDVYDDRREALTVVDLEE